MEMQFTNDFLQSIVWVDAFQLTKNECRLDLVSIENDVERKIIILLYDIIYFIFRQENGKEGFEVIETVYEKFNDCTYVDFMKSEKTLKYSVLRFHSGIHHLLIGFKDLSLIDSMHESL